MSLQSHCLVLCVLIGILYLRWLRRARTRHTSVDSIRSLLNPNEDIDAILAARARTNQRLVRTFHLTNTFVSADVALHSRFRANAERLISGANDWHRFHRVVDHAVSHRLASSTTSALDRFDTFVQTVTLQTVLVGLLNLDAPEDTLFDSQAIAAVARSITELWALSKEPRPVEPALLCSLRRDLDGLFKCMGISGLAEYPNPLDIIIPTWETLWRVVAAALALTHDDATYRAVLRGFTTSSFSSLNFRKCYKDTGISAEGIVLETMRLYPPSKHISRSEILGPRIIATRLPYSIYRLIETIHVAAVLDVQRDPALWGDRADHFDPARRRDESAFVAFGHGRLSCIAKRWAPIAVAVILGATLERIDGETFDIKHGGTLGGRSGWEDWHICKVKK